MSAREVLSKGGMQTGYQRYGFHNQQSFRDLMIEERKRTERSKRPFVLVLVEIVDITFNNKRFFNGKILNFMASLSRAVRGTDILGWFENYRVMGVIFTETQLSFIDLLTDKVKNILNAEDGLVKLRVLPFPSDKISHGPDDFSVFYQKYNQEFKKKMVEAMKRVLDISLSLMILVFLLPLFLVIGIMIKKGSNGPVFFKQQRVGKSGKPFTLYKFRSMYENNDDQIHRKYVTSLIKGEVPDGCGVYKITNDPRVTSFGSFLRRSSLDEFPQFFNVLKGEMSLVGPRPAIPYELSAYQVWHWKRFMECKPGVTGLWQVLGRSKTTFDGMVRMDIRYLQKQSFLYDLWLMIKTPAALLFARGAY